MSDLKFKANGKLLLFGEYFVMDGALALAVPTKAGQSMDVAVSQIEGIAGIEWNSLDAHGQVWFSGRFDGDLNIIECSDAQRAESLQSILLSARKLNPEFASSGKFDVTTRLDFPLEWGLGSSSTLLSNLAAWANVDPFELFFSTFKGSGYDIACASASQPVFYHLNNGKPQCIIADFRPSFAHNLYFIYLNRKKNSREAITFYDKKKAITPEITEKITQITRRAAAAIDIDEFMQAMREHEAIVSARLSMFNVQDLYFQDFAGVIKSLGAWGGDFVLAATKISERYVRQYFNNKGFNVIKPYPELVLDTHKIEN